MKIKSLFIFVLVIIFFRFECIKCLGQDVKTSAPAHSLKFSEIDHNFGDIPAGQSVSCEFIIENTGNKPYIINDVTASCGCTKPEYSPAPVLPGKTTKITVVFNGQGMGAFSKTITIYDNSSKKYHQLFVSGNLYDPNTRKHDVE